jgi:MerR family copper efflux transcriptional regulator
VSSRARGTAQMTVGALSRRTGVPAKALREYEDAGLIYSCGRSPGNYRLFDDEALWCVEVIRGLRAVGLTLAEISDLAGAYLQRRDELIGPRLATVVAASRARTEARIAELRELLARIDVFEASNAAELIGHADFRDHDPRTGMSRA